MNESASEQRCYERAITPLVSIIIPFYNIADCVEYCIASVDSQTFNNFEVICVDDGSTDETGTRLDTLATSRPWMRVIHTENGGLSAARNAGVAIARGTYVTFVDGDDVISPVYLESLCTAMESSDNRVVIGRHVNLSYNDKPFQDVVWETDIRWVMLTKDELVDRMLYDDPMISAWAHLAPKEMYLHSPFPVGKLYEDTLSYGGHVLAARSFAVVENQIYGYIKGRGGSITKRRKAPLAQAENFYEMVEYLDGLIERDVPGHGQALAFHKCLELTRLSLLLDIVDVSECPSRVAELRNACTSYVRGALLGVLRDRRVSSINKVRLALFAISPKVFRLSYRVATRDKQ